MLDVLGNILEALPEDPSPSPMPMPGQPPSSLGSVVLKERVSQPHQDEAADVVSLVLEPWLEQLLVALKTIVTAVWEGGAKQTKRVRKDHMEAEGSFLNCVPM